MKVNPPKNRLFDSSIRENIIKELGKLSFNDNIIGKGNDIIKLHGGEHLYPFNFKDMDGKELILHEKYIISEFVLDMNWNEEVIFKINYE